jgi:Integrase/Phage integrase, N-terminal
MKERKVHGLDALRMLEAGEWVGAWARLTKLGDGLTLKQALTEIFARCHWLRKSGKPMSEKSRTDYFNHVMRSYDDLVNLGYQLRKPWNLEQKHIAALCSYWSGKALSGSTVQNRLMALSWFGAVIGRPGLIRGTHDYQAAFGAVKMKRQQATDRDRSPLGCNVSAEEVVSRAMAVDETFGHMVKLQLALGLRDKEVIRARPLRDMFWRTERVDLPACASELTNTHTNTNTGTNDDATAGDAGHRATIDAPAPRLRKKTQTTDEPKSYWMLRAGRGSKGGRSRKIQLWQGDAQALAVREVCEFLEKRGRARGLTLSQSRDQSLGWSSLVSLVEANRKCNVASIVAGDEMCNIAQWPRHLRGDMNHYYRCAVKAGFTKADLGFTPHGFRHFFALRELEVRGFRADIAAGEIPHTVDISSDAIAIASSLGITQEEMAQVVRYAVSRQLGHSRSSVTSSYYGKRVKPLVREDAEATTEAG